MSPLTFSTSRTWSPPITSVRYVICIEATLSLIVRATAVWRIGPKRELSLPTPGYRALRGTAEKVRPIAALQPT